MRFFLLLLTFISSTANAVVWSQSTVCRVDYPGVNTPAGTFGGLDSPGCLAEIAAVLNPVNSNYYYDCAYNTGATGVLGTRNVVCKYTTDSNPTGFIGWTVKSGSGIMQDVSYDDGINPSCTWPQIYDTNAAACVDSGTCDFQPGAMLQAGIVPEDAILPGTICTLGCVAQGSHFEYLANGTAIPWYQTSGQSCSTDPPTGNTPDIDGGNLILPQEPLTPTAAPTNDPLYEKTDHIDWQLERLNKQVEQQITETKTINQTLSNMDTNINNIAGGGGSAGCDQNGLTSNGIPCTWVQPGTASVLPDALTGWNAIKADFSNRVGAASDALKAAVTLNLNTATCTCGPGVTVMGININICICDYLWALEYFALALKVVVGISVIMILLGI